MLRIVGKKHQISAGLITGGKKEFEEEQERVIKMNILVATPGRLLQVLFPLNYLLLSCFSFTFLFVCLFVACLLAWLK